MCRSVEQKTEMVPHNYSQHLFGKSEKASHWRYDSLLTNDMEQLNTYRPEYEP